MLINKIQLKQLIENLSSKTGYSVSILEKDYYISLLLNEISKNSYLSKILIFKGGTSLSKFYLDYYRMSEDLDFVIDYKILGIDYNNDSKTKQEKLRSQIFNNIIENIIKIINSKFGDSMFEIQHENYKTTGEKPIYKHNKTNFLKLYVGYKSVFLDRELELNDLNNDKILIEILFSEIPEIFQTNLVQTKNLIKVGNRDILPIYSLNLMNINHIFCDKFCAMTDRTYSERRIAIRDYFDIKYLKNQIEDIDSLYKAIGDIYRIDYDKGRNLLDLNLDKDFIIKEINQQKQLLLNMTGSIGQSFFEKESFDDFYDSIVFIQNQVKSSMGFDVDIHINDCF